MHWIKWRTIQRYPLACPSSVLLEEIFGIEIGFFKVSQYTYADGRYLKVKQIEVKFHLDKS